MPGYDVDFRLDGYRAADAAVDKAFWTCIGLEEDCLYPLAKHHLIDGSQSFFVLHNSATTWGHPGDPQIVALHLLRDMSSRTFRFEHVELPLPSMAQSWLVARGCPKDAIRLPPGTGTTPADSLTRRLEERLVDGGNHYALLTHYTDDLAARPETTVLLRAIDEDTPQPFRIFVEEADLDSKTHTLREGAFSTYDEALVWLDNRDTPLPPPRADPPRASLDPRARAAQSTSGWAPPAAPPEPRIPPTIPPAHPTGPHR